MAVSDSYLKYVMEQLNGVRLVSTKRMFGGVGLYSGEWFFGVIDNDTLFFKVDDTTAPKYRKRRMPPFAPIPGGKPMMGYYQVPPAVLEDADAMTMWAGEAIGVSKLAPPKRVGPKNARSRTLNRTSTTLNRTPNRT